MAYWAIFWGPPSGGPHNLKYGEGEASFRTGPAAKPTKSGKSAVASAARGASPLLERSRRLIGGVLAFGAPLGGGLFRNPERSFQVA